MLQVFDHDGSSSLDLQEFMALDSLANTLPRGSLEQHHGLLVKLFKSLSPDKRGAVDFEHYALALVFAGSKDSMEEAKKHKYGCYYLEARLFDLADKNHDGLQLLEFMHYEYRAHFAANQEAKYFFADADSNRDGLLKKYELVAALHRVGSTHSSNAMHVVRTFVRPIRDHALEDARPNGYEQLSTYDWNVILENTFFILDKNGDHGLSADELCAGMIRASLVHDSGVAHRQMGLELVLNRRTVCRSPLRACRLLIYSIIIVRIWFAFTSITRSNV